MRLIRAVGVATVIIFGSMSSGISIAKTLTTSDQIAWEAQWRQLKQDYDRAPNEMARKLLERDIERFISAIVAGDELADWRGTLKKVRLIEDKKKGMIACAEVDLAGPESRTNNKVFLYAEVNTASPELRARLLARTTEDGAFVEGSIVSFSGVVDPKFEALRKKAGGFFGLFAIFKDLFGIDLEELFNMGAFGARLHVDTNEIVMPHSPGEGIKTESLRAQISAVAALHDELSPLLDEARGWDCQQYQMGFGYAPCGQFLERARALGVDCALKSGVEGAPDKPSGVRMPMDFGATVIDGLGRLAVIEDGLKGRFPESSQIEYENLSKEVGATEASLRQRLADAKYVTTCMNQLLEEQGRIEAGKPRISANSIELPVGLSWGMSRDQTKEVLKRRSLKVGSVKACEENCSLVAPSGYKCGYGGQTMLFDASGAYYGTFFDGEEKLAGFYYSKGGTTDGQGRWTQEMTEFVNSATRTLGETYGEPNRSDLDARAIGTGGGRELAAWVDAEGSEVRLWLGPSSIANFAPNTMLWVIYVHYRSADYLKRLREEGLGGY